jgi:4-oxalocrotonate tautomerase
VAGRADAARPDRLTPERGHGRVGRERNGKEAAVPVIDVKLYDHRVTEESVPKMIERLTDALAESSGAAKEHINVIIQGVPAQHWGLGGKPGA